MRTRRKAIREGFGAGEVDKIPVEELLLAPVQIVALVGDEVPVLPHRRNAPVARNPADSRYAPEQQKGEERKAGPQMTRKSLHGG